MKFPAKEGDIIYSKNNVCIHPPDATNPNGNSHVPGYLTIHCQRDDVNFSSQLLESNLFINPYWTLFEPLLNPCWALIEPFLSPYESSSLNFLLQHSYSTRICCKLPKFLLGYREPLSMFLLTSWAWITSVRLTEVVWIQYNYIGSVKTTQRRHYL